MQKTVCKTAEIHGVGLHSGAPVLMRLCPAAPNTGRTFVRTDLSGVEIPALWSNVVDTRLCTALGVDAARIGTVEHLMAALSALEVDNVCIEIDGPEIPVMDGSATDFVAALDSVGLVSQSVPRRIIEVLHSVRVERGEAWASLTPSKDLTFTGQIDFTHPSIGQQDITLILTPDVFRTEIAPARTFCLMSEVEAMRASGLARGGSLDNAVVLDENGVMNEGGLRTVDEFVRHKILDAIGDMALVNGVLCGAYTAYRPGHALNNALLHAVMAMPNAWREAGQH